MRKSIVKNALKTKSAVIIAVIMSVLFISGCGKSSSVSSNDVLDTSEVSTQEETTIDTHPFDITMTFTGDINIAEGEPTTKELDKNNGDITKCISPELIKYMKDADITLVNNEFCYSDRGAPLANKMWTFRAGPERAKVLNALGVDVAQLANNHVYDYGKNAFLDTLQTLQDAGIHYVGAGKNIAEASEPYYFICKGKKIAYVAASEAEKFKMTPQATKTMPGILRCYDTSMFLAEIAEADAQADYVIANVHWGTEYDNMASKEQREFAREMIDAGADAVIGTHPHVLQGMEFYQGKPIIYSLGNFWFNDKDLYSGMLALTLTVPEDGSNISLKTTRFVPCLQYDLITTEPTDAAQRQEIIDFEQKISYGVTIDADGIVME